MVVKVENAGPSERAVLRRLMEFYRYDWSDIDGRDLDTHGEFGYPYLDHYWTDSDRHAFLFNAEGMFNVEEMIAGFALVRETEPTEMAEFFVMRKYRRLGIGRDAARIVLGHFPGPWRITQLADNPKATLFWRTAIPTTFDEHVIDEGMVEQHSQSASVPLAGGVRLLSDT